MGTLNKHWKLSDEAKQNHSKALKGKPKSKIHKKGISKAMKGKNAGKNNHFWKNGFKDEKHYAWKGNEVGYTGLHQWIRRKLGKPNKCEHCGIETKRRYEWANKSHRYFRNLSDWIRLCVPCHKKYDFKKSPKQIS